MTVSSDFWRGLEAGLNTASRCPETWETREWDADLGVPYQRTHECVLAPHATGNHRDAASNVRVRFEE